MMVPATDFQWQDLPTFGSKYTFTVLKSEAQAESTDDPVFLIGNVPVYVLDCPHLTGVVANCTGAIFTKQ